MNENMKECSECGRKFGTEEALNSHIGHIHSEKKLYASESVLQALYWEKEMTTRDIASLFNIDNSTILYHMKKNGVDRKEKVENVNESSTTNHIELSTEVEEFIEGCLLGDGSVFNHGGISSRYMHTDKNLEYLDWFSSKFNLFGVEQAGNIRENRHGMGVTYQYESKAYPEFRKLRKRWYGVDGKIIPIDFEITPIKMFNWYIGDGTLYENRSCFISSFTFSDEELDMVKNQLRDLGITANNIKRGIYITVGSSIDFFEYIMQSGYAPPPYSYKFYEPLRSEIYG